jgi:hypothetical protein
MLTAEHLEIMGIAGIGGIDFHRRGKTFFRQLGLAGFDRLHPHDIQYRIGAVCNQNLIKALIADRQITRAREEARRLSLRSPKPAHQVLYGYALCLDGDYGMGLPILIAHRADAVLNIVGVEAIKTGQPELAEKCFAAAVKINPADPRYAHNLQVLRRQHSVPRK